MEINQQQWRNEAPPLSVTNAVSATYFERQKRNYNSNYNKICAILQYQEYVCSLCGDSLEWGAVNSHHNHSQEKFHPNMDKAPTTARPTSYSM